MNADPSIYSTDRQRSSASQTNSPTDHPPRCRSTPNRISVTQVATHLNSNKMTMVVDAHPRQYGASMGYDSNMYSSMQQPNFTDPWAHQTSNHGQYSTLPKHDNRSHMSMSYQQSLPPTSAPMTTSSYLPSHSASSSQSSIPESYHYSSSVTTQSPYNTSYPSNNYTHSIYQQQAQQQRKTSDATDSSRAATASFGELDASRGMLALSHQNLQDLTPRNIQDVRSRSSTDAYGFPAPVSGHSSLSNESGRGYPYYGSSIGGGSIADSSTEYSSAASDSGYDMGSRTLPRPTSLMNGAPLGPPAPQSMMGQFSSKMSGNTQKKHKCKVCDKRFTRPSSLQTHMYSHTGEKPFACDVEGCGRNFSVVSNLRRHKKVHKGEGSSVTSGSDHEEIQTSS